MTTKRAAKNNDPSVTEGLGPEADDETKARIQEADEANIAANEATSSTRTATPSSASSGSAPPAGSAPSPPRR
jgi:hypothetical protein